MESNQSLTALVYPFNTPSNWRLRNMEISLLADAIYHPHEAPKIAKWYYDEWAYIAPNMTEEIVFEKVTKNSVVQT